jgi:outer membrane protein assembly factor BamB
MNKLICWCLLLCLQSCTVVDDYLLGKDNLPSPKPLPEITNKVKLNQRWSKSVGKSNHVRGYLKLKPVVRKQVIYLAEPGGQVQALDVVSGKANWTTDLGQNLVSGPALGEGYVVVGTSASTIVVLNQADGKIAWKGTLSGDALSKAVIADHKVIVKTIDGHLYAFELSSGKKIWVMDHGTPNLILKASSAPILVGNVIVVGFSDGKLDGVDLETGRILWQKGMVYASGSSDVERLVDIDADPIVRDGLIYLASYQGYVAAFSISTGQFVWNKEASVYKNIAMDANTLYYVDSHDVIWALDRLNGQVRWKQLLLKYRGLTEPLIMDSWLIFADKLGYLHILSKNNGEILARNKLNAPVEVSPAVSAPNVFVMSSKGVVERFTVTP